jgi:hypothetical protein
MDKKQLYFIFGCACVLLLIIGCLFGVLYQKKNSEILQLKNLLGSLNSDVVPSIVSYGKVTEINGRNITISFNDNLIVIYVREDTPIYKMNDGQKEINFDEIKVGDELNVKIRINPDEESFESESIIDFNKN